MGMIETIRSKAVHAKVFLQRSLGYVGILNGIMLLFLVLSDAEKYGIDIDIQRWFIVIIISGTLGLIFIGWLEDRLGVFKLETKIMTDRNPQIIEIRQNQLELKLMMKEIIENQEKKDV